MVTVGIFDELLDLFFRQLTVDVTSA